MLTDRLREIAQGSLLLNSLPPSQAELLLKRATFRKLDRGETLFLQDEPAHAIHVVTEGWVKLYRVASNGSEAVVSVFRRGESFGEAVALKGAPYPVSAEAVTKAEVLQIPANALTELMHHDPGIGISVLASTFSHLHGLVSQLEQLKAQTGPQRVAEFLLSLCDGETGRTEVTLPYDKVLIAGRLGMKPESLSRAFAKLKPAGVTITRNTAVIDDMDRLAAFAETDPAEAWSRSP